MSKFKIGDWWSIEDFGGTPTEAIETAIKHLTDDGWELDWFIKSNRHRLGDWGRIGIRSDDGQITLFESDYDYEFRPNGKSSWSVFNKQQYECPYAVIEELQVHVETLEEALEKVTKELLELRGKVNSSTETSFKPIADMTMGDWKQALNEIWLFEDGVGSISYVKRIDGEDEVYPVIMSDLCSYRVNGWYANDTDSFSNIIKRIK